jgi:hypothetical protein
MDTWTQEKNTVLKSIDESRESWNNRLLRQAKFGKQRFRSIEWLKKKREEG